MNNDLIRRGELQEKAEMLISVARVMAGEDKVCQKAIDLMQQIVDLAKAFPAVDAVEVVRCNACKHARERDEDEKNYLVEGVLICTSIDATNDCSNAVWPDHFCSYGERREDDA